MKMWKYLNFPNEEKLMADVQNWYLNCGLDFSRVWNTIDVETLLAEVPILQEMLTHYNRKAVAASILKKDHITYEESIHIDSYFGNMKYVIARILIPVINCEGSYTVFYKTDSKPELREYAGVSKEIADGRMMMFDEKDCIEIDRVETTRPYVMRTNVPHGIKVNMEKLPRITLSLKLDKDPVTWLMK